MENGARMKAGIPVRRGLATVRDTGELNLGFLEERGLALCLDINLLEKTIQYKQLQK